MFLLQTIRECKSHIVPVVSWKRDGKLELIMPNFNVYNEILHRKFKMAESVTIVPCRKHSRRLHTEGVINEVGEATLDSSPIWKFVAVIRYYRDCTIRTYRCSVLHAWQLKPTNEAHIWFLQLIRISNLPDMAIRKLSWIIVLWNQRVQTQCRRHNWNLWKWNLKIRLDEFCLSGM